MTRPTAYLILRYNEVYYNRVLLYYVMSIFSIESVTLNICPPNGKVYFIRVYVWHIPALGRVMFLKMCLYCEILPCYKCILSDIFHSTVVK
jgi:hypothetical protein